MKRMFKVLSILVMVTLTLSGCENETITYSDKVTEISEQVEQVRELNIDNPSNEESYQDLLEKVEIIEVLFKQLTELDTPEEYKNVQEYFTTALSEISDAYEQFSGINPAHIPFDDEVSALYTQALNTYFSAVDNYKLGIMEIQVIESSNSISSVDK